jgi:hypothetical protein
MCEIPSRRLQQCNNFLQPSALPKLPPLGFTHIDAPQLFSSTGKVKSSVVCWHALATYLSLIDSTLQPGPDCQLGTAADAARAALARGSTATALSVPAGGATVNITFNVGVGAR